MAEPAAARRTFFRALIGLLGAVGLGRYLTPVAGPASGRPIEVPEADVPAEGALVLPGHRCAVVRDEAGLRAVDLTCPHLGCTVKATEQGFACPCHGSRFDREGRVLSGPAARSLDRLPVERRAGVVTIARG